MSYSIRTIDVFDRQAKFLAKHYPSFRNDLADFLKALQKNPLAGSDLGGGIRKVRMAIASKVLLSVYDKSEHSTISDKEIMRLRNLAIRTT